MNKRKSEPNNLEKLIEYTKKRRKMKMNIKPVEKIWKNRIIKLERQIRDKKRKLETITSHYDLEWDSFDKKYFKKNYGKELNTLKEEIKNLKEMLTNYKMLLNKNKKQAKSTLSIESTKPGYKLRF